MADLSKLRLILSKLHSTYLFACQCNNEWENNDFNTISAQPAEAEASGKEKQGKVAEKRRQRKQTFTCQARQRLLKRLLLIYLSTSLILLQLPRRRLYLPILLKCLKDKKLCAKRALGRLFRTPLMNWSATWTSRALPTNPRTGCCTGSKLTKPRSPDSIITALRLEQKTSGLFDSAEAGNRTVAGGVSGSGFKVGKMEPVSPAPGEDLGGLFQDVPIELTEADYLDSFMDLSNFLTGDMEEKVPTEDGLVKAFEEEMMGKVDFSGILTSLKEEESVFTTTSPEVVTSSAPSQTRKRKLAESSLVVEPYLDNCIVVSVVEEEQLPVSSTSDHDYTIKKPRLESTSSEMESLSPVPVSSTSMTESESPATPKSKYRERRDKNNVASQRSRLIRKQKYLDMELEADRLEAANVQMRAKITELEQLAKFMKAELIKKMTEK